MKVFSSRNNEKKKITLRSISLETMCFWNTCSPVPHRWINKNGMKIRSLAASLSSSDPEKIIMMQRITATSSVVWISKRVSCFHFRIFCSSRDNFGMFKTNRQTTKFQRRQMEPFQSVEMMIQHICVWRRVIVVVVVVVGCRFYDMASMWKMLNSYICNLFVWAKFVREAMSVFETHPRSFHRFLW